MGQYRQLLKRADAWFGRSQPLSGGGAGCRGCGECCHGLFDITLLDAMVLREGFAILPAADRDGVLSRAHAILGRLRERFPSLEPSWFLSALPEEERGMTSENATACPLLDASGRCLAYEHRPLTCRLYGLPHVDDSGEIFLDDWCGSVAGADPLPVHGLRWEFRRTFVEEGRLLRSLAESLCLPATDDLDTLIPAALAIDLPFRFSGR